MEIGSDFWSIETKNAEYFLTGRTAQEYIVRDILQTKLIKSALLPSFCCHTMIEPFLRHKIPVRFYDVIFDGELKAELPEKEDHEILLYLDYFGFGRIRGLESVADWDVTIEDRTHSWLRIQLTMADYQFISFRKWTGFTGIARAEKKTGRFAVLQSRGQNKRYEEIRNRAMHSKADHLSKRISGKKKFLGQFAEAEELLETDYVDYQPSYESLTGFLCMDWKSMKIRRRKNADILIKAFQDQAMFPLLDEQDCPLCVPILVPDGKRDELRKYLADHEIYCPVHWPLSGNHNISAKSKEIYQNELSMVCDQRYKEEEMYRIIDTVQSFWKER